MISAVYPAVHSARDKTAHMYGTRNSGHRKLSRHGRTGPGRSRRGTSGSAAASRGTRGCSHARSGSSSPVAAHPHRDNDERKQAAEISEAEEQPERGRHGREQLSTTCRGEIRSRYSWSDSLGERISWLSGARACRLNDRPTRASARLKTRFEMLVRSRYSAAAHHVEREVLMRRSGRHLARAHQFGEARDGD